MSRWGERRVLKAASGTAATVPAPALIKPVSSAMFEISGCQDNQLSYDGDANGMFTGTFLNLWNDGAFRGDYRSLHNVILTQMPPYQTPNLFTLGRELDSFVSRSPFTVAAPYGTPSSPSETNQPANAARPTLRYGSSGSDVRHLQEKLVGPDYRLTVDGHFGYQTMSAVKSFQRSNQLSADGIARPGTWQALAAATTSHFSPQPDAGQPDNAAEPGGERPTLRYGDRGPEVTTLQELLYNKGYRIAIDDFFGSTTQSAVRSLQRSTDLTVDGIVGSQVWGELLGNRSYPGAANGLQAYETSATRSRSSHDALAGVA